MSQYQDKYVKPQEQQRNTRRFVAMGYNDACVNFRVQFSKYDFDTLRQCISDVTDYNEYHGETVAKAFDRIKEQVEKASFGREGSPVLYLYLVNQDYIENDVASGESEWVKRTPERMAELVREVKKAFSRAKVDEFYTMDEGHNENLNVVRLWWD